MTKITIKTESGSIYEIEEHIIGGHTLRKNGRRMLGYLWPTTDTGVNFNKKGELQYLKKEFEKGLFVLIWDAAEKRFYVSSRIVSIEKI